MIAKKTTTLNLRVDPLVKDAVRYAANQEHRSVANMVEMMIRQYCRDAGYPVLEQTPLLRMLCAMPPTKNTGALPIW